MKFRIYNSLCLSLQRNFQFKGHKRPLVCPDINESLIFNFQLGEGFNNFFISFEILFVYEVCAEGLIYIRLYGFIIEVTGFSTLEINVFG